MIMQIFSEVKNKITQIDYHILKLTDALIKAKDITSITDRIKAIEEEKEALENKYDYYCDYVHKDVSYDDLYLLLTRPFIFCLYLLI